MQRGLRARAQGGAVGPALAVVALGLIGLVEQLRLVWHFRLLSGNDQTLLWYAGRDWGQLHPRAPHFYGQRYGNTLETIPVEILRRAGMPPNFGLPLTLALLSLAMWIVLAWVALRRGHPTVAIAAAAAPIVLSTNSAAFIALYGGIGRVLGVCGLALLLVWPRRFLAASAGFTLCGFALAFDVRSALFVAPVLVYLLMGSSDRGQLLRAVSVAAMPLVCWFLFIHVFYDSHPDYVVFGQASLSPSFGTLGKSLAHSDRYWQMFAPELVRWWWIPATAALLLIGVLLATRDSRFVVPALLMCAAYLFALAAPPNLAGFTTFIPVARLVHFAPIAVWFLALLVAESHALDHVLIHALRPTRLFAVIIGLALLTAMVRVSTFNVRFAAITRPARHNAFEYVLHPTPAINSECSAIRAVAMREAASLVVYIFGDVSDDTAAYACGAIEYGRLVTLVPFSERRTWLLRREDHVQRDRMILRGVPREFCALVAAITTQCEISRVPRAAAPLGSRFIAAVHYPPQTAIHFLGSARIFVRPFGPHCSPTSSNWSPTSRPLQCHQSAPTRWPPAL